MKLSAVEAARPDESKACLRLVRALCGETRKTWLEDSRYLNMMRLAEQKKEAMRLAA